MKAIRRRVGLLAVITGLGFVVWGLFFFQSVQISPLQRVWLPGMAILFLLALLIKEFRTLQTAGLIIENKILYIPFARLYGVKGWPSCNFEVFISCFGILLNSQVIKFNQEGIRLQAVDIGLEFIDLTYGKAEPFQTITILHPTIAPPEMERIMEKFRYETGVLPVITDNNEEG